MITSILSSKKTFWSIAGIFFFYVFLRSILLSFSHDEGFSFIHYIATSYREIWEFEYVTANNHFLNSILSRFSFRLLSSAEWGVRLPNVLCFLVLLYYAFLLLWKQNQNKIIAPALLIILCSNHYILEFYSLCRGYGMGVVFLFIGIFYLFEYIKFPSFKKAILLFLFLTLGVLTHLVLLVPFIAIFGIFCVVVLTHSIQSKQITEFTKIIIPLVAAMLVYNLTHENIEKLIEAKQLYYGGDTGFFQDTIKTIIWKATISVDFSWANSENLGLVAVVIYFIIGALSLIKLLTSGIKLENNKTFIVFSLIGICAIGCIMQHELLDSKFLMNRTGLYFLFLYVLLIVLFLSEFIEILRLRKVILVASYAIAVVFSHYYIKNANFNYSIEWKEDADVKEVMDYLSKIPEEKERGILLEIDWYFEPTVNYYIKSRNLNKIRHVNRDGIQPGGHFYFVHSNTSSPLLDDLDVVKEFPISGTVLYKRN